ncbi:MAG: hypothetical protein ACK56I_22600, partial [bacterium]
AAQVRRAGHAEGAVGVAAVGAHQRALVQRDVGPVQDVLGVPEDGDAGVVLADGGLVAVGGAVADHPAAALLQPGRDAELGRLYLHLEKERG